ncbi:FUSC family protein [Vibrio algicola]|uniref:FUSC family protein n=1 Tax=Vibrio algicola TaxID=2662262 RepID=A0A5Q0TL74_9VIBR|nr:FUSC family protein [Vibrio algicola]
MLSRSTKEAIKAALSVVIALCLAIFFQWEKPYWAGIAVVVTALNETFAHSLQKGQNRVFGSLMGVCYALFLLALFPQDRFLFLTFYGLFLGLSLFMSSDEKHGYIFVQGYTVCTIICCMGEFDSANTFHYMILRTQETLLGVAVFTLVYKVLWPVTTQTVFMNEYIKLHAKLKLALNHVGEGTLSANEIQNLEQSATHLHHILLLPNNGSYDLQFYKKQWLEHLRQIQVTIHVLELCDKKNNEFAKYISDIKNNMLVFDHSMPLLPLLPRDLLELTKEHTKDESFIYHGNLKQRMQDDVLKVVQGLSMFITAVAVWIYFPVPGGVAFPMIAGILATNLPPLPPRVIRDAFWGTILLGSFYLIQLVFIMPSFTEIWQLASFYLINIFAIWKVFDSPRMGIFRVLAANLLLVLTSGALNLTPSYSIDGSLMMIVYLLILLMIARVFSDLFHPKASFGLPN